MSFRVEIACNEAERARVYEFRYRIYVEEMRIATPEADHERRWLCDMLDDQSLVYALLEGESVVGTLRTTLLADAPSAPSLIDKFAMGPAVDAFGAAAICTTSRFMLDPAVRHGTSILRLMRRAFEDAQRRGLRLNYGDCSPHLLPFYEHLGFRRYTRAFNDSAYGFKVPILMLLGDRERLDRVRSPLARVAERAPDDAEARSWFERCYPDQLDIQTADLLPEGVFLGLLAERIASDPLHSVGLLRGLERDEAERFLGKATLIHASAEDHLVRQGELGATLFVLLSGVAEVVIDAAPDRAVALLGPGDTFGEMGFLTPTPRTANVIARTACEIVVLSAEFLHALLARDPAIAAKILLNLSRILARRLSDMNRQLAAQRAAKSPAA